MKEGQMRHQLERESQGLKGAKQEPPYYDAQVSFSEKNGGAVRKKKKRLL